MNSVVFINREMEEAEVPAKGKNLALSLSITNDEYLKFSTEMDEIT